MKSDWNILKPNQTDTTAPARQSLLGRVEDTIAVVSGKGGVGTSAVALHTETPVVCYPKNSEGQKMAIGQIKKLVHLSLQTHLPNARLVPDHNDKGYGIIADDDGRDVYFPHNAVDGRRGFDDLRTGQTVEYTLDSAPYLRAKSVQPVREATAVVQAAA